MDSQLASQDYHHFNLLIDLNIYPLTAVQKTAYWFTKDYFVDISRIEEDRCEVKLRAKVSGKKIDDIEHKFKNDLLDQALREEIGTRTEALRNLIIAHALSKTSLLEEQP